MKEKEILKGNLFESQQKKFSNYMLLLLYLILKNFIINKKNFQILYYKMFRTLKIFN